MPDGDIAVQLPEDLLVEDAREQAHLPVADDRAAVGDGDPGGLLAAVLQGVQAEVSNAGHIVAR